MQIQQTSNFDCGQKILHGKDIKSSCNIYIRSCYIIGIRHPKSCNPYLWSMTIPTLKFELRISRSSIVQREPKSTGRSICLDAGAELGIYALHPGLNQWTSASLIKFKINAITLGLITIEIYMARTSLDPCCSTASTGPGSAPVWRSQSLDKPIVSNQIDGSYSITWNLFNGDEYLSGFELNSKQSKAASSTTSLILYATTHFSKSTREGAHRGRNVCRGPQLGGACAWQRASMFHRRGDEGSGTLAAWPSLDVWSTSSGSDKRATWPNVWPDSLVQISLGRD